MQAQNGKSRNVSYHRSHCRTGSFDKVFPNFLEQVTALLARQRFYEVLLGSGQNAPKSNHQQIIYEVGIDGFGTTAHVFLLKATHAFTYGGFNFARSLHHAPTSQKFLD